jgi:thioredoxin-related protein
MEIGMRLIKLSVLLLVLISVCAGDLFALAWKDDFNQAMAEAKSTGKPVLVDFYTEWCTWCKKLDKDTYTNKDVEALSGQFVCAKIDADKNRALVVKYMVRGYPTVIFLNPDGQMTKTVSGYLGPDEFSGVMKFALSRAGKAVEPTRILTSIVSPVFKLSGVFLGPHISKAMINGVSVVEGDVIEGAKVVHITAERVVLIAQGKQICLDVDKDNTAK